MMYNDIIPDNIIDEVSMILTDTQWLANDIIIIVSLESCSYTGRVM